MDSRNDIATVEIPAFEVEFDGCEPVEIALDSGYGLEYSEVVIDLAEVGLIDGGIIPEGETLVWEQVLEFSCASMVFVYVGPTLVDIDATWSTSAWFRTEGWFRSESW